ncbi:MFS transporter [Halobaculum lipolyticum]|uniref:MFS transporter n=1 Tax=Halobaculum lipolyticum TaxID=3032001 RepID=A0ABD5WDU4_9EURY|nr:MFS transporter [Halobaculum sp. DT31]
MGTDTAWARRRALALVGVAELLAMTLWFSASAVAPELTALWDLTPTEAGLLTTAVQLGFVVGALASAALTLADVLRPRVLLAASAVAGAVATASIALFVDSAAPAIVLRFLTGVALAGVYPTGMKILAGWFRRGRGLAIGVLVGALTVGSATPHLLRAVGGGAGAVGDPRLVMLAAAGLATVGAVLVLGVRPGPYAAPASPFDPGAVVRIVRNRGLVLADLGYFGHMWELYAVWTWLPVYLAASYAARGATAAGTAASLLAFGAIAVGGVGALTFGAAADRVGRTTVTAVSMVGSGAACLLAGVVFGAPTVLLAPFVLAWGFLIVADSAQFSAAVTELADEAYVGSALTLQTAVGFLLTVGSIQLTPVVAAAVGWRWAFAPLAVGPAVGTLAMLVLGRSDDAAKLAGGRG